MSRVPKCSILLASLAVVCISSAFAARPGGDGGGDSTNGKIQFVAGGYQYSMNADGSAKQVAGPALVQIQDALRAPLSARKYGGGRWQLMLEPTADVFDSYEDLNGNGQYDPGTETVYSFPGYEVFAYRWNGLDWDRLQVTNTNRDGLRENHYASSDISLAWSNDGQDSFFSVRLTGYDLDADGRYLKSPARPQYIARIHVSGAELDAYALAGADPLIQASDSEFEIVAADLTVTVDNLHRVFSSHSWSPDGSQLVIGYSGDFGDPGTDLFVWDVATGTGRFLAHTENDLGVNHHWSPDGRKIVIGDGGTNILMVNSDSTGLAMFRGASSGVFYAYPHWSPDSQWVVYRKLSSTKSICKISVSGGKEVNLTKDLGNVPMFPLGWTAD